MQVLVLKKNKLKLLIQKYKKQNFFFLLVFFLFISTASKSQDIIWLDKNLNRTSQSKALYYKVGEKSEGYVSYFYKNRTLYRKVFYKNGKVDGRFFEYYGTGELKEIGTYIDGLREGNWKEFYKNGKIRKKGKYINGEKVGVWKTFYKNVY